MKQLESGFKRTINCNKYQSKLEDKEQNRYFDYLIDWSFQEINRLFNLSLENRNDRKVQTKYYIPNVEIKDYNVIIDGRNFFVQPIKHDLKTYDNIRKIATGQGDDCTTGCLLDYTYFKKYFKLIPIDLSKQKNWMLIQKQYNKLILLETHTHKKKMQQYFSLLKKQKKVLDFSKGTVIMTLFLFKIVLIWNDSR